MRRVLTLLSLLAAMAVMNVWGQVIDPQIYVCTGCTAPPGTDPNPIDPTSINVGFAGDHTAVSPLLIIVGVPDGDAVPTISLPTGVSPAAAGTYYGLNNATSGDLTGVLEGTMTSSGCSDAYNCSGIANSGGGNSESFVNWTTDPFPGGAANPDKNVTQFDLYAYAIDFALVSGAGGNSPINIDLDGGAANEFVIAYNCAVAGDTCSGGDIGATPFTNAGITSSSSTTSTTSATSTTSTTNTTSATSSTSPVPEPNSIVLFGSALLGVTSLLRKKLMRS